MKITCNFAKGKSFLAAFFCIIGFMLASPNSFSQNIPDVNFANTIRSVCPTCIDASNNLLPPATNLTILDVSNKNIADLTGIGGFTSLLYLYCNNNQLTSLPTLPVNLGWLFCNYNQLISLPDLPNKLSLLYCNNNQLTDLPILPNTLRRMVCSENKLTFLRELPNSLAEFHCSNNLLTILPNISNIRKLYCSNNRLRSLPTLPNYLLVLSCYGNELSCLPTLPNTLYELHIDPDKITCLSNMVSGLLVYKSNFMYTPTPPLCPSTLTHTAGTLATGTYVTTQTISNEAALSSGTTNYYTSQAIRLNPGFQTEEGRTFSAEIRGCK